MAEISLSWLASSDKAFHSHSNTKMSRKHRQAKTFISSCVIKSCRARVAQWDIGNVLTSNLREFIVVQATLHNVFFYVPWKTFFCPNGYFIQTPNMPKTCTKGFVSHTAKISDLISIVQRKVLKLSRHTGNDAKRIWGSVVHRADRAAAIDVPAVNRDSNISGAGPRRKDNLQGSGHQRALTNATERHLQALAGKARGKETFALLQIEWEWRS